MRRRLSDNLKALEERIEAACARAGRARSEVTVVTVTKSVGLDVIRTLVEMGTTHLGENRAQELARRAGMVAEGLRRQSGTEAGDVVREPVWHMIGHLQRNKVKALLPWVQLIHSVDSLRLAEEIDAQAKRLGKVIPVLLEVNAADEPQKQGIAVAATTHLAEQLQTLQHLRVHGLMTMAPLTDDLHVARRTFDRLRELFDEVTYERICGPEFCELSMGMSNDFEPAIEAGATFIRVGSLIFDGIESSGEPLTLEER